MNGGIPFADWSSVLKRRAELLYQQIAAMRKLVVDSGGDDAAVKTVRRDEPKVGRNDPCPCGSGKKYKKCHGAAA